MLAPARMAELDREIVAEEPVQPGRKSKSRGNASPSAAPAQTFFWLPIPGIIGTWTFPITADVSN
jgi:hypothetical protein